MKNFFSQWNFLTIILYILMTSSKDYTYYINIFSKSQFLKFYLNNNSVLWMCYFNVVSKTLYCLKTHGKYLCLFFRFIDEKYIDFIFSSKLRSPFFYNPKKRQHWILNNIVFINMPNKIYLFIKNDSSKDRTIQLIIFTVRNISGEERN